MTALGPPAAVDFHRLAAAEYRAARRWYARRSAAAARAFDDAVGRAAGRIAANPLQGTPYRAGFRWVRAGRFPYLLYYSLPTAGRVTVLAFAHARRRPGYWLRRTNP